MAGPNKSRVGRLWASIHPPRPVTLGQLCLYVIAVFMGVLAVANFPEPRIGNYFAAGFLIVPAVFAAPAAWRGAYWLEIPLDAANGVGLVMFGLLYATRIGGPDLLFPAMIATCAYMAVTVFQRCWRSWLMLYPSGRDPRLQAKARAERAEMELKQAENYAQ